MKPRFNVTGLCVPQKHYMVDIQSSLEEIRELIDNGAYFTINRARQYGKTTTLNALAKFLAKEYLVVSLDFQAIGNDSFKNENTFSLAFASIFLRYLNQLPQEETESLTEPFSRLQNIVQRKEEKFVLLDLFHYLLEICRLSSKPVDDRRSGQCIK